MSKGSTDQTLGNAFPFRFNLIAFLLFLVSLAFRTGADAAAMPISRLTTDHRSDRVFSSWYGSSFAAAVGDGRRLLFRVCSVTLLLTTARIAMSSKQTTLLDFYFLFVVLFVEKANIEPSTPCAILRYLFGYCCNCQSFPKSNVTFRPKHALIIYTACVFR